ncbi:hypothetical protein CDQ84_09820 [Clostridium thermosuccinogenes]|uniref:Uncharacterized protein n=1 Tax=Clostridium thermosuccinogenes TaxID=84032 RepID=A0A2K2FE96_9CLOT|nr:hypothetical protein CDO33_19515 [Pseudoclostridium thermosuccinogenes]PNT97098.1 hypothetical protein CDQ85_09670 [Pseudoclostridium thermosuccinogenes]PNT99029.1 hypothetical protein CDQ84_09820 [Pseudoclostridium thermosuccinogenes]
MELEGYQNLEVMHGSNIISRQFSYIVVLQFISACFQILLGRLIKQGFRDKIPKALIPVERYGSKLIYGC